MARKTTPKKKDKNWIQEAIKNPGGFTAKAKRAKKSIRSYAAEVLQPDSKASEKTKRQARLAKTLTKMAKARKKKK